MLTRSQVFKQYLEDTSSSTPTEASTDFTSSESEESTIRSSQHTSLRTFAAPIRMEEADAAVAASLRKRLERIYSKLQRSRDKLSRQKDEESPSTSDYEVLKQTQSMLESQQKDQEKLSAELYDLETNPTAISEDELKSEEYESIMATAVKDCRYLLSQRSIYSNCQSLESVLRGLTSAYEATPDNDHKVTVDRVLLKTQELEADLHASLMNEEEELRGRANATLERAYAIQARVSGARVTEVKPTLKGVGHSKSNVKLKYIDIPSFSGKTEDWLPFKRVFSKAVHNNDELDEDTKLTYLVQAMADSRVQAAFAERLDEDGAYKKFMAELESQHDKPRWMHRRYCENMRTLTTNAHTREGMKTLINEVNVILNGFIRLKGENCRQILTSMVEAVMDAETRALWNQRTDKQKTTPPIEELLQFMNDQADQLEDKPGSAPIKHSLSERKGKYQQGYKFKGSTHNSVRTLPTSGPKGSQQQPRQSQQQHSQPRQPFTKNTASCVLCQEGHHLFYCPTFEGYSVPQRKEYVMSSKLCLNCLKPHHVAHDCHSSYRCKASNCGRKHNTLLHEERPAAQPQVNHQSNTLVHSDESDDDQVEECLLMTSQVDLTGPTGKTITVRALLDGGSTLSILSNKIMKFLHLEKTGGHVSIAGVAAQSTQKQHPLAKVRLSSNFRKDWSKKITVAGMDKVTRTLPLQAAASVRELEHLKDLTLADNHFDQPGRIDLLLGQNILKHLFMTGKKTGSDNQPEALLTVFGWTIQGGYTPSHQGSNLSAITHVISTSEDSPTTDQLLSRFYEIEEPAIYELEKTPNEIMVENHYQETHSFDEQQHRYMVRLPKSDAESGLGESKTQALNRARANERSLIRKGKLEDFNKVMKEYVDMEHAQLVNGRVHQSKIYYMPIHAVFKDSSSTKVRAVFDASAKSTNGKSLNDLLAVGPTLHPTLSQIILKFRTYRVAISADVTKMYREVVLHPEDRSLHRFIWRNSQQQEWQEYEMQRVTFGVAASPYLAIKSMQQAALDFGEEYPKAQWHITHSFYVDDLMGGADSPQEAINLFNELRHILSQASFHLKKWRSGSSEVLKKIVSDIQEKLPTQDLVDMTSAKYPKALGLTWDSHKDKMATCVNVPPSYSTTKSGIVGDIAKTFDILGWLAPAILPMKLLYRDLARAKIGWEEEVNEEFRERHRKWREQLHVLEEVQLPRHYFEKKMPTSVELHGFADASKEAYGAVVYIRATYARGPPSVHLVISKSKVTPPQPRTIPELELCGAKLLAQLVTTTRQTLEVPLQDVYAYSDSTVVLAWLDGQPRKDKVFISNRIASTINLLPPKTWNFVPTTQNPADAASRGLTALELKRHTLWWNGPPWLKTQPVRFPTHPQETARLLQKEKEDSGQEVVLAVVTQHHFEQRFNSYGKLVRTTCWMLRFVNSKDKPSEKYLTSIEGIAATKRLVRRSQERSFPEELKQLTASPPKDLSRKSSILVVKPIVNDGVLQIGGRLNHTSLPDYQKHPTILSSKDVFTQLLFLSYHHQLGHCGPSVLLAHAANIYYVVGGRKLSRSICSK